MTGKWGGKREGAGRPPGPGKWSAEAKELRAKLRSMGKSPVEILVGNMLADQERADKLSADLDKLQPSIQAIDADRLKTIDAEGAKAFRELLVSFRGLLVECANLKATANACAKDAAPYMEPKVTQKDEALEIDLPKIETIADIVAAQDLFLSLIASGTITTDQGLKLSGIAEAKRKAIETLELERRLTELENKRGGK